MEEILASIRRIIADEADPATSSAKAPPVPPSKPAAPAQAPAPAPKPAAATPAPAPAAKPAAAPAAGGKQDDIDAILAAAAEEETQDEPDVLELTEPVKGFKQVNAEDVVFREESSEVRMQPSPAPQPRPAAAMQTAAAAPVPAPRPAPVMPEAELLSAGSSAMVNAAFGSLANTMLGRGRTLEDLVQEMMRPMLKQWLDENLPGLVERMVRAEIERVSRGR